MRRLVFITAAVIAIAASQNPTQAQVEALNGKYDSTGNSGIRLSVKAVRGKDGAQLTVNAEGVELQAIRKLRAESFVYTDNGCIIVFKPWRERNKQALAVEVTGTCDGENRSPG